MKTRLFVAAAFLAVAVTPLHAATITVTSIADNGPGSLRNALANAADGDTIDASGVSGTILLTNGELLVTNSVDIVGPGPDLLAINGNFGPGISGFSGSRVFYVGPSNAVLISSLTITNGSAIAHVGLRGANGGGIYNDHSTLTVSNCALNGSTFSSYGGAICNDGGLYGAATMIIADSTLSGNSCNEGGGGIVNDGSGHGTATMLIVNSTIHSNSDLFYGGGIENIGGDGGTADVTIVNTVLSGNYVDTGEGGGIYNAGGTVKIIDSTLRGNYMRGGRAGGAIYNDATGMAFPSAYNNASVELIYSSLISNSALEGGAIGNTGVGYSYTASVEIVNCALDGNTAETGGGIDNSWGSVEVINSTFEGNSATQGGGINNFNGGTLELLNSTLSDNTATNGASIANSFATLQVGSTILSASALSTNIANNSGTVTSLGYNLSSDDGGGFLTATGDQTNTNPMLDPAALQNNGGPTLTIALLCDSPAIDQGYNFSGSTTDQRGPGFVRTFDDCAVPNAPGGDGTDIGAYEVQLGQCPHPPVMTCPTNQSVDATSPAGATVTYPTPMASNGCPVTVVCTPPSGSEFAIGDTVVSCVATDTEGNEATCSFTVHVEGGAEQINDLIALVQQLNLNPWITYVLTADLQSASNALGRGNTRAACIDLDAFIFEVDFQTWWGQIWPPSYARLLDRNAQRIQNVLGCHDGFGPGH